MKVNFKLLFFSFILAIIIFLSVSSVSEASSSCTPTLYMLSSEQEAQMLSSVIKTDDGKCIVIDGGWTYDAEKLISVIKHCGGTVDAWLITHADPDHIGALYEIMSGRYKINISAIYCSLANNEWYNEKTPGTAYFVKQFKERLKKYNVKDTHKNDLIYVGSAKIYVLNDRYDMDDAVNNSSIVYKIFIGDLSILYLGDLAFNGGEKLLAETPPYLLSSDIVQMAHHGQAGVGEDVYKAISPKIALWSTPRWLWTNQDGNGYFKTLETRQWMSRLKCKNYVTADGDIILPLNNIFKERWAK